VQRIQRAARALGPGRMRVLGGLGGLVACGVAGVAVAASPKPADAPLQPPVDPTVPLSRATPSAQAASGGLVIPATPVCSGPRGSQMQTPIDPSLRAVVTRLRAATTRAQRLAILQGLTPDQRVQITALQQRSRVAGAAAGARCRPGTAEAAPTSPSSGGDAAPMIEPDVVAGGPTPAPATTSYVS
jgi:hypothetical protein